MAITAQLFSFPGLTLIAILELFVASKAFPEYFDSNSHLAPMVIVFLTNYVFGVVFWVLLYPTFFSPLRHLPGPKSVLPSNYRAFATKDKPSGEMFVNIVNKYPGEELITLDLMRRHIFVANSRLLADVLVHNCYDFVKPRSVASFLRYILGDGLVIVEGDQHKFLRKNINPAFHFRHIGELYPMMWTKAGTLTRRLKRELGNASRGPSDGSSVVELTEWASKVTLDIINVAGMGRRLDAVEKTRDPLLDIYRKMLEPSQEKLIFSGLSIILGYQYVRMLPWKRNAEFQYNCNALRNACGTMIDEKRNAISKHHDDHFDILALLIKSNNFSDDAIKEQLLTFLAAGHETTASSLTWASYLLAKHPEIQTRLREEITEALPADCMTDPPADLASLLKPLPYLNGIIQETLRLFPTVPMTMREALRDTRVGEQFIPKGTNIVVSIWMINRSPSIWGSDAGEFRPERWITDGKPNQNGGSTSNYDFLTFLHGPRSCIGQEFAKAELRCLLAAFVKDFTWSLAMDEAKIIPKGVITIRPAHGMYLKLTPLESQA